MGKHKYKHKQLTAFSAILWRVTALALVFWLMVSGILTWAVSSDMYRQLELQVDTYMWGENHGRILAGSETSDFPGVVEHGSIMELNLLYNRVHLEPLLPIVVSVPNVSGVVINKFSTEDRLLDDGYEVATLYYDESGEILWQNGNYLTFVYTSAENWKKGSTDVLGYGYVDLDTVEGGVEAFEHVLNHHPDSSIYANHMLGVLRITGYTREGGFYPVSIDQRKMVPLYSHETVDVLNDLDAQGELEWETMLTVQGEIETGLETVYAWSIGGIISEKNAVTSGGTEFASLSELLYEDCISEESYGKESLWDAVIVRQRTGEKDLYGPFNFAVAVRCRPIEYAVLRLIPFYLISLTMVAVGIWLTLRRIRLKLTRPLEKMTKTIREQRPTTPYINPYAHWREPYELEAHILQAQADREQKENELAQARLNITRLNTALEYAKNAEENRRQLVSHLTHELKTPLAVIHSYAEGLQAGIAEEKKDQYLSVILAEAEKMDAMVLQMLDLSRLEAGKVKLAADQVSLIRLTQSVLDKFALMMREREQELICDFPEDFSITADEARIGQAITNLVSNAYKYTPAGGKIRIKIYIVRESVYFTIENTSAHLTEEALEKVWDSFYRVDPARTEPGTGLGLTLVKSIVELHRGSCIVRNTMDRSVLPAVESVEFGFILPI